MHVNMVECVLCTNNAPFQEVHKVVSWSEGSFFSLFTIVICAVVLCSHRKYLVISFRVCYVSLLLLMPCLGEIFYAITILEIMQLGVYLRTYALEQMVQAASSSAGLRTIKRVEQTLQDLGVCFSS